MRHKERGNKEIEDEGGHQINRECKRIMERTRKEEQEEKKDEEQEEELKEKE